MPQWFRCRNSSVTVQESDGFGLPHTQKVFRGRLRTRVSCGSLLASTNCDGLIPKLQSAPRSRGTFCTVSFLRLSLGCHRLSWQRQSGQSSAVMATSVCSSRLLPVLVWLRSPGADFITIILITAISAAAPTVQCMGSCTSLYSDIKT